ncbi:TonB-dependent siderophore receptor [Brasilonema sp. CT11]|nr:TonB-dependent siderophore receptor [Brasilonema sp. CT11]
MKRWQLKCGVNLWLALGLSGCLSAVAIQRASAQVKLESKENSTLDAVAPSIVGDKVNPSAAFKLSEAEASAALSTSPLTVKQGINQTTQSAVLSTRIDPGANSVNSKPTLTKKIPRVSEIEPPLSSARMLVQSPTPQTIPASKIVQVSFVKANPTNKGLELVLQTSRAATLQLQNRTQVNSNTFIVDIPNAQLRLPPNRVFSFRSQKPIAGITEITVVNFDANTIRVTVIGEAAPPIIELYDSPKEGLIFSVASTASLAQQRQQPQTQPSPTQQPENQTQQTQPRANGDEPIELVVTGQRDGYNSSDASTATKTDTPLRDIPQSIQAIPATVIQDQGAVRLNEIVRNVSGVANAGTAGERGENYTIRGFDANVYKNGFLDDYFTTRGFRDSANIERVEVLKGPASVLFGRLEPSGIINLITKKPLAEPYYNFSFTAGSYSFYRPTLDFSGPLTQDGKLGYRLNIAYENSGSFRDFVNKERFFIAPVLSWKIGDKTNLTLEGEYLHTENSYDDGLYLIGGKIIPNVPISRNLNDPRSQIGIDASQTYLTLNHEFNQNLSLRTAFRVTTASETVNRFALRGFGASDDGTVDLLSVPYNYYFETYFLQNDLTAKFNTGFLKHTLLFGLELGRLYDRRLSNYQSVGSSNVFNPVYNFSYGSYQPLDNTATNTNSFGIYLQDQISVFDNLKLLVGGRFDTYHSERQDFNNDSTTVTDSDAFSPRVGVVYQPTKEISLFANYSRSFVPVSGSSKNGDAFEPTRGTGYEVGIKGNFLNNRLSSTLAFYTVTKTNVLTADPSDPTGTFSIQVGEQRARGIELDIAGEILPGWKVIASYAYTDAQITEDNTYPVGNTLGSIPQHSGSLWTTYTFQKGALEGFGFGGGIFAASEAYGDVSNFNTVPGFVRTDAALFYKKDRLRASVNFKNLFDIRYFEGATTGAVNPAEPFTVQGTISWEF